MSARQRHRGAHQASPAGGTGEVEPVAGARPAPPEVPGPDRVPGAGPGTSTEQQDAAFLEQLHEMREDLAGEIAHEPGQAPEAQDLVVVDDGEIEAIRWAGYDSAIADAEAYRDRALETARERLDRATRAAYADYGQAVDAADATFAAARRAAMHARELAHAGQAAE